MDDRIAELVKQYDVEVYKASRIKGAWILETNQGLKYFSNCNYSESRAKLAQNVKQYSKDRGFLLVDFFVPTKEGTFLVQGPYSEMFIMRDWFYGEECNVKSQEEVLLLAKTLAKLHLCMTGICGAEEEETFCYQTKLTDQLEKRNRELRRVRAYIREKKQKNSFEQKFLSRFEEQYEQAQKAKNILSKEMYEMYYKKAVEDGCFLHGNYTHHSVLVLSEEEMAVHGFDKVTKGVQIHDFYLLFRKMMEKWDWDVIFGNSLLEEYNKVKPISKEEYHMLQVLVSYPEKFWKVANQYYNNRKSWIPEKNMQKLLQTMEQAKKKEECIQSLFGNKK